jgi:hypothetical protein
MNTGTCATESRDETLRFGLSVLSTLMGNEGDVMQSHSVSGKLIIVLAVACCSGLNAITAQRSSQLEAPLPAWTVELRSSCRSAPKTESNKSFFKDFNLEKLAAVNLSTELLFLSDDVLVAYHTNQAGQDWRTADRRLKACFFKTEDGSRFATREWPSTIRKDIQGSEAESESRIMSLRNGEFLVVAGGTLMLYSDSLHLIGEHKLEPLGRLDMWGVKGLAGGRAIFLRHERLRDPSFTYQWIDADTFQPLDEMTVPGIRGRGMSALEDGVYTDCEKAICLLRPSVPEKLICKDPLCRDSGANAEITPRLVGLSGRGGIGVLDVEQGMVWSDVVGPEDNYHGLSFGAITPSLSGNRFAVWVSAYRKYPFNFIQVHKGPDATVLVFNTLESKHVFAATIRSKGSDWTFALSPDGTKLATFDGVAVTVYKVD